jgi:hypothetical protein
VFDLRILKFQQWDTELAFLAGLNAKTCVFGHDGCRKTGRRFTLGSQFSQLKFGVPDAFKLAGQNIALGVEADVNLSIVNIVERWFVEYKNCNMSMFLPKF